MEKGKLFDASAVVSEALNAVQGTGAAGTPLEMSARVRRCERLLADHVDELPPASVQPLHQLDALLARIEQTVPVTHGDMEIVRLELTQRILQLGQLIFPSAASSRSDIS